MEPIELMRLAISTARRAFAAGELPIGAVVLHGDVVVAEAFTQERTLGRRLVHAELMALTDADMQLGWRRAEPLTLVTNLEPCVMCVGAAMAMQVDRLIFGLYSPGDGGAHIARDWPAHPDTPFFTAPRVIGDVASDESRTLFAAYAEQAQHPGMRAWARSLATS